MNEQMATNLQLVLLKLFPDWQPVLEDVADHDCKAGPEKSCQVCDDFYESQRRSNAADLTAQVAKGLGIRGVLTVEQKDGRTQISF